MSSSNTMPAAQQQLFPSQRRNRSNGTFNVNDASGAGRTRNSSRRYFKQRRRQKEPSIEKNAFSTNTAHHDQHSIRKSKKGMTETSISQGSDTNVIGHSEPKERPKKLRKVYRRKKVLRTWVLPALFLVPLGIIWLEYYIGKIIGLEDVKDVYQEQLVDPWDLLQQDLNASRMQEWSKNHPLSPSFLANISYTPRIQCPPGQRRMINVHNPTSHSAGPSGRLIPKIVHQQSRTRCLTMKVDRVTTQWAFRRWSYYIHDEDSRSRLFDRYCDGGTPQCEFPLLNQIVKKCFDNRKSAPSQLRYYFLQIELWKFFNLWIFGGVYVDLDFLPGNFNSETINRNDDGFLVIDSDAQMLSTKLMAVSPRHPIMYYAVHEMLMKILLEEYSYSLAGTASIAQRSAVNDTDYASEISGSSILGQAFRMYQEGYEAKADGNSFLPGVYHGVMNRTVRVVASDGLNIKTYSDANSKEEDIDRKNNELVMSIFKSEEEKKAEYLRMGMVVDAQDAEDNTNNSNGGENGLATSCLNELYHLTGLYRSG